jgi:hypothetical protein
MGRFNVQFVARLHACPILRLLEEAGCQWRLAAWARGKGV